VYRLLAALGGTFLTAQQRDDTRALVLQRASLVPTRTIAFGGDLFTVRLERDGFTHQPLEHAGAMLILWSEDLICSTCSAEGLR